MSGLLDEAADGDLEDAGGGLEPRARRPRNLSVRDFASPELYERYQGLVEKAHRLHLGEAQAEAMAAAEEAIRIYPTADLMAICALISRAQGHYTKWQYYRMLEAYLSHDGALWQELYTDFLNENKWHLVAVCLWRLSQTKPRGSEERRQLELELADMFVALEQVDKALTIYERLWEESECRDLEVLATISSLCFQLDKWERLEGIMRWSADTVVKRHQCQAPDPAPEEDDILESVAEERDEALVGTRSDRAQRKRRGGQKRTRDPGDSEADLRRREDEERRQKASVLDVVFQNEQRNLGAADTLEDFPEDFFDDEDDNEGGQDLTAAPPTVTDDNPWPEDDIKIYVSIANVHVELLLEMGRFQLALNIILRTSATLRIPLADLPPILVLKYIIACANLERFEELDAQLDHLLQTISPEEFGDVLYDAAKALEGTRPDRAEQLYRYLLKHARSKDEDGDTAGIMKGSQADQDRIARDVALLHGIAVCMASTVEFSGYGAEEGEMEEAEEQPTCEPPDEDDEGCATTTAARRLRKTIIKPQHPAMKALLEIHRDLDPFYAPARVLLSRLYANHWRRLREAEAVLLPQRASARGLNVSGASAPAPETGGGTLSLFQSEAPELRRESGFQRVECDLELVSLYTKELPAPLLALERGIPIMKRLIDTAGGLDDTEDRISIATGTSSRRRGRPGMIRMPKMARASSVLVPASRVAASLLGDVPGGSAIPDGLLSTTRSIATSYRASQPHSVILLGRRGAATGSSVVTSKATTALSIASSSRAGSTAASVLDADLQSNREQDQFFRLSKSRKTTGASSLRGQPRSSRGKAASEIAERSRSAGIDARSVGNMADLESLEQFEAEKADCGDTDQSGDEPSDDLPSLDSIAEKHFKDPDVARLFLSAMEGQPRGSIGSAGIGDAVVQSPNVIAHDRTPNLQEFVSIFGRDKIKELALQLVDCYAALGAHEEARRFAEEVLAKLGNVFRRQERLLAPLRVAALRQCVLSGNDAGAARMVTTLLQSEGKDTGLRPADGLSFFSDVDSVQRRHIWETLSILTNAGMRSKVLTRMLSNPQPDLELLCIEGNISFYTGNYQRAILLFLHALSKVPADPLLLLLIGISYVQLSQRRTTRHGHDYVRLGLYYLQEHVRVIVATSPFHIPEALYNLARSYHFFSVFHLAMPLYRRVVDIVQAEEGQRGGTRRHIMQAAQYNLAQIIGSRGRNLTLMIETLPHLDD